MITYQDFLKKKNSESELIDYLYTIIHTHKRSDLYIQAEIADEYARRQNRTIMNYQKLLYTISGEAVPDNYSANYKIRSNFFDRFVTQEVQFLLGNGVTMEGNKEKLGDDFDTRLQEIGRYALIDGISFGFWNYDHLEVFRLKEFAPLYDEQNGALMAGVRFWQISKNKPLRATLYEIDGYTNFIWKDGKGEILKDKQSYIRNTGISAAGDLEIYDGENYPTFPIVPLWGNPEHQSELVGIREQIDCYDLIKSGFANDLDDASQIYWTIQNAGGMDDVDLATFVRHMKTVRASVVEDPGAKAESHTIEVPYASREALLDRIKRDLYDDFMALDVKDISGGAVTATQIKAAYEPMNNKADMFEYCVIDFLDGIFALAGIDDNPTFTRSLIVNAQEEIQMVLQSATYLPEEYVTHKILELLGDADKSEDILEQMQEENIERFPIGGGNGSGAQGNGQETEST